MDADELLRRYAAGERDFTGIDFTEVDLSEGELSGADLSGINLSGANLNYANLRDVVDGYECSDAIFHDTIMPDGSIRSDSTGYKWPRSYDIIESQ